MLFLNKNYNLDNLKNFLIDFSFYLLPVELSVSAVVVVVDVVVVDVVVVVEAVVTSIAADNVVDDVSNSFTVVEEIRSSKLDLNTNLSQPEF